MMSDLIGIPNLIYDPNLIGGGIHETNSGGHVDVHLDFNYIKEKNLHRRLNILIYFNKDWQEEYGGYLDIWDRDIKKCYGAFSPIFNRICGFATSEISFHGVTPLTCPPNVMRRSFACYYYTKKAPAGWDGEYHSTVFKARPNEWIKGTVLMPTEEIVNQTKVGFQQIKSSIKKVINKI
jgi:Rps23 Pro-64 3,4-dihydroxylase Tpa1-like proline 4-hydroxylase